MIPTEDNYIDWILPAIKEYFRRLDYKVRTYSIGQVKEKQCPIDRIFAIGNKIVGLQFKRPLTKEKPWRYENTPHQHKMISKARWIFYCLPDFVDLRFQEVALFHCKFQQVVDSKNSLSNNDERYYRWGAFADALMRCVEGLEIGENTSVEELLKDMTQNPHDTYLSLNKQAEEVYIIRDIKPLVEMETEPA